jgi:hypothetical protein
MEPLVAASVSAANASWVVVVGGVLSVLALAATAVVLGSTAAERDSRLLASGRALCVASTGLLLGAGFDGLIARWAFAVVCVAFLLAVLAVALRYGQGRSLQSYLDTRSGEEEPAWWPAFERGLRRYASTPRREQNPLRRAVTREGSQSSVGDGGHGARRSSEMMRGGRP